MSNRLRSIDPQIQERLVQIIPPPSQDFYWAELKAVVSCIIVRKEPLAEKIVVSTDSEIVVDLFSSH